MPLTSKELKARFDAARSVARAAGQLARGFLTEPQRLQITSKGPQDIVTAADLAVERLIVQDLTRMFPDDSFLAEETFTEAGSETSRALWVIDPIDGTGNFAGGRSDWCVSIGFMHLGEPVIGVIDIPSMHEQYAALRGWVRPMRTGTQRRAPNDDGWAGAPLLRESRGTGAPHRSVASTSCGGA